MTARGQAAVIIAFERRALGLRDPLALVMRIEPGTAERIWFSWIQGIIRRNGVLRGIAGRNQFLYIDANRNGTFESSERVGR